MSTNDWLSRIAQATGTEVSDLQDPRYLEDAVADLWLSSTPWQGAQPAAAPPTLAHAELVFAGLSWSRCLATEQDLSKWGGPQPAGRSPAHTPAIGISLGSARELAHAQGGRLPRLAEWEAAVSAAAPGNHSLKWGGPSVPGFFPAARSGLLDGWGNAWEWTEEGLAVGGSFASPPHPAPVRSARLIGFRVVR